MQGLLLVLVATVVLVGVISASNLAYWSIRSRREAEQAEIARRIGTATVEERESLFQSSVRDELANALGSFGREMDSQIKQAGNPYTMAGLLQRCGLAGLLGAVLAFVIFKHPLALLAAPFAAYLPVILLKRAADKRGRAVSEQLPDALDLVARSLQAGHGLADSIRMCAEEMPLPIAGEFARVYDEHNLGRDFREALENLSLRNPRNFDLKIFVSSVLLQRDTGGNLIEILTNISRTIRERFVFQGKVQALTAEARISALILGVLPFFVAGIIMWMRPEYLVPLIADPLGHMMLAMIFLLFGTGVFLMRNMAKVEM